MVSQPTPPSPTKMANAQAGAEMLAAQSSAIINNPNQVNPWGQQSSKISGWETVYDAKGKAHKVPRYETTMTLSPSQQGLFDLQNKTQANLGQLGVSQSKKLQGLLGTNLDTRGLSGWKTYSRPKDLGPTDRQSIEDAMMASYDRSTRPADAARDAQLAARGASAGSAIARKADIDRQDSRGDATRKAYLASGQEARSAEQLRYQLASDWASAMNNLRQGQFGERTAIRNQPINEITALLGQSQVTTPQFQPFSRQSINAAPIGQYMQQNYNAQAQAAANTNAGLFGLGSSLITGGLGMWG